MDPEQLREELLRLRKEQFNLRMQRGSEHLPQTHLLKETRRDIARVKTTLGEKARENPGENLETGAGETQPAPAAERVEEVEANDGD